MEIKKLFFHFCKPDDESTLTAKLPAKFQREQILVFSLFIFFAKEYFSIEKWWKIHRKRGERKWKEGKPNSLGLDVKAFVCVALTAPE